ncbi:hypothetical protein [Agrococcus jejuensis]|uniref:hypothetical protein n=1 Tax=Agrococcus jejuensis TaxID=399736 RepID=UPI0012F874D5|nr:hypothetical protein [Agrococcus jejuensis]
MRFFDHYFSGDRRRTREAVRRERFERDHEAATAQHYRTGPYTEALVAASHSLRWSLPLDSGTFGLLNLSRERGHAAAALVQAAYSILYEDGWEDEASRAVLRELTSPDLIEAQLLLPAFDDYADEELELLAQGVIFYRAGQIPLMVSKNSRAADAEEPGLAVLVRVARHYGHDEFAQKVLAYFRRLLVGY